MKSLFLPLPGISWTVGLPLVFSLLGLLYAVKSYRLKHRAEQDAAGRISNLSMVVYSARITGEGNYVPPLHFVLDRHPGRSIDFPITIDVQNLGLRTASGVGLYLRYPLSFHRWEQSSYKVSVPTAVVKDDEYETVHHQIGDIHPGGTSGVVECIRIPASSANSPQVAAFRIGFQIEQQDAAALNGEISVGIMRTRIEDRGNALSKLSRLLPEAGPIGPERLRDRALEALMIILEKAQYKRKRMIIGRLVNIISYDRKTVQSKDEVDTVLPEMLLIQNGVQDRRGDLLIPGINAKNVLIFHGRLRPEIGGLGAMK